MLSVENLDVFYGDAQALDNIAIEIEQGAIVTIVGQWCRQELADPHDSRDAPACAGPDPLSGY
jgi:hypothetical protein